MYLSERGASIRNSAVALVNGTITLIILLIAPLGLAAVIINTLLVTIATFFVASIADRIVTWLLPGSNPNSIDGRYAQNLSRPTINREIERYDRRN